MNRFGSVSMMNELNIRSVRVTSSFFADSPTESPMYATVRSTGARATTRTEKRVDGQPHVVAKSLAFNRTLRPLPPRRTSVSGN